MASTRRSRRCVPARANGRDAHAAFTGQGSRFVDDVRAWQTVEPAIDMAATRGGGAGDSAGDPTAQVAQRHLRQAGGTLRTMHLLLVEDDERLRRLLKRMLEEERHVVDARPRAGRRLESALG